MISPVRTSSAHPRASLRPPTSAAPGARSKSAAARGSTPEGRDADVAEAGMAEIELAKLQRQFRLMEGDRRAYSEESRLSIARQRTALETLRKENDGLREELRLLQVRAEDRKKDNANGRRVEELAEMQDTFSAKIKSLQARAATIATESAQLERTRRPAASAPASTKATPTSPTTPTTPTSARPPTAATPTVPSPDATAKAIRTLENRLEKALVKYNRALESNRRRRGDISALRFEREAFDRVLRRCERDVGDRKRRAAEVIEESGAAYEQRDDAQAKLVQLKEKSDKEYQAYLSEVKELDRILEQDRKLKGFMAAKLGEKDKDRADGIVTPAVQRAATAAAAAEAAKLRGKSARRPSALHVTVGPGSDSVTSAVSAVSVDGVPASPSLTQASRTGGASIAAMSAPQLLAYYHDVWRECCEAVVVEGEPTAAGAELAAAAFARTEAENFSLFNYVTEINNEMEQVNDEIGTLKMRMDELQKEGGKDEAETMGRVRELETALTNLDARRTHYESELSQYGVDLSALRDTAARALAKLAELGPVLNVFGLGSAGKQERERERHERKKEVKGVLVHRTKKEGAEEPPATEGDKQQATAPQEQSPIPQIVEVPGAGDAAPSTDAAASTDTAALATDGERPARIKSATRKSLRFSLDVPDVDDPEAAEASRAPTPPPVVASPAQSSGPPKPARADSELAALLAQVADIPGIPSLPAPVKPRDPPAKPQDPQAFVSTALAMVERRTTDLLLFSYLVASLSRKPENVAVDAPGAVQGHVDGMLGMGPAAPVGGLAVEVPAGDERESDGDGEAERPMSREELKARTVKDIAKREQERREHATESALGPRKAAHGMVNAGARKARSKKK